ncbi:hypothetical protein Ancab_036011 [Ancistrocladus abbreviatus]
MGLTLGPSQTHTKASSPPINPLIADGQVVGLTLGPSQTHPKVSCPPLNPPNADGAGCGLGFLSGPLGSPFNRPPPTKHVGRRPRKKHLEDILQLRLSKRLPGKVKRRPSLKGQQHCDSHAHTVGVGPVGDEAPLIQRIAEMETRDATEFRQLRDSTTEYLDQEQARNP